MTETYVPYRGTLAERGEATFPRVKLFKDANGYIEYWCGNYRKGAVDSDNDWVVKKYSYDGSGFLEDLQELVGSVDNRASLGWV